jgi:RNA-dependent RNA polymerase
VKLPEIPSAVQLRFYGAKGVCLSDMDFAKSTDDPDLITLRPSQIKIRCDPRYQSDLAKLTVDVVRVSVLRTPASVTAEAIVILADNGVPHSTFHELYRDAIRQDFAAFLNLPSNDSPLISLIQAVFRLGGVMTERRTRLCAGAARARGVTSGWRDKNDATGILASDDDDPNDDDDADTLYEEPKERSVAWYPDDISGLPSSLAETCLLLLFSGFRPDQLAYCQTKLRNFLKTALASRITKYKIPIPLSVSGIIVPGECHKGTKFAFTVIYLSY